uniref:Bm14294 n=1 Tax=Brugia malayi TaxID=6279 RepID=A0A1I9G599_BRUMA|nr:Bm14294 [Brugia malayi]
MHSAHKYVYNNKIVLQGKEGVDIHCFKSSGKAIK